MPKDDIGAIAPAPADPPSDLADRLVGIFSGLLILLGLLAAARARDPLFALFGWGLVLFGGSFIAALIRGHFDRADAARHAAARPATEVPASQEVASAEASPVAAP